VPRRPMPTTMNWAGRNSPRARANTAGNSFRAARSPVAPNISRVNGSGIRPRGTNGERSTAPLSGLGVIFSLLPRARRFVAINPNPTTSLQLLYLLPGRGPAPAPAEQVDLRAHLAERVARGVDAVHPGDRVKDDLPPLGRQLVHALLQDKGAELHQGPALGPEGGGIGHLISR